MLFLVLLSGCTAKWATLNNSGLRGLAAAQLILSSAVAFACITLIAFALIDMVKKHKANKLKAKQEKDGSTGRSKRNSSTKGSFLSVEVRAGPDGVIAPELTDLNAETDAHGGSGESTEKQGYLQRVVAHLRDFATGTTAAQRGRDTEKKPPSGIGGSKR